MNFQTETTTAKVQAFGVLERYGINENRIEPAKRMITSTTEDAKRWRIPQDVPQAAIDELKEIAGVHVE